MTTRKSNKYQNEKKKKNRRQHGALFLLCLYEQKLTVSFLVFNHQSEPDSPLLHIRQEGGKKGDRRWNHTGQRSQN